MSRQPDLERNITSQEFEDFTTPARSPLLTLIPLFSLLIFFSCTAAACKATRESDTRPDEASSKKSPKNNKGDGSGPDANLVIARLADASIDESSGIAASRRNPGVFWTHNDAGDDPIIFAIDRQGKTRGVWRVEGAKARDWEDIAIGPGPESGRSYIYIGDTGNNKYSFQQFVIYRIPEPVVEANSDQSSRKRPLRSEAAEAIRLVYPDGNHESEALMVHPESGDIYIATKTTASASTIYKLTPPFSTANVNTPVRVGAVHLSNPFGAMITGGDISPDGRRVILCDYTRAYELRLGDGATASFDSIWSQPVVTIGLGKREQGEAVCYRLDGAAILATSEGRHAPLIEVVLHPPAQ